MTTLASFLGLGRLAESLLLPAIRRMLHTSITGRTSNLSSLVEESGVLFAANILTLLPSGEKMDSSPGGVVVAKRSLAEGRQLAVSVSNARHNQRSWSVHLRLPLARQEEPNRDQQRAESRSVGACIKPKVPKPCQMLEQEEKMTHLATCGRRPAANNPSADCQRTNGCFRGSLVEDCSKC